MNTPTARMMATIVVIFLAAGIIFFGVNLNDAHNELNKMRELKIETEKELERTKALAASLARYSSTG